MKDFIENGKKAYNMELKILSVLEDACKAIKQHYGIALDLDTIPIDDSKTFELLQQGQTGKVFVFHRKALQRYLRELHPENLDHLAALYALYFVSRIYGYRRLKHYIARKMAGKRLSVWLRVWRNISKRLMALEYMKIR